MESPGGTKGVKYQGVERKSFAYKMMRTLGWNEGQGLGASGQGITSHIKTKKKSDNMGVGRDEADKAAVDWTINTSAYDKILSNLRAHHDEDDEKKGNEKGKGGEAGGLSKKELKEEKRRQKKEAKRIAKAKAKKVVRAQGRYQKRESAKAVKNYSAVDLAAILGHSADAGPFGQIAASVGKAAAGSGKEEEERKRIVIVVDVPKNKCLTENWKPLRLASNWWGNNMFVQSSQLLGDQEVKLGKEDEENAFTEQDQEDIYTNAQKIGTQNRQGLGMSSRIKISGGNWSGKKMTFGEEGPDGEGSDDSSNKSSGENYEMAAEKGSTAQSGGAAAVMAAASDKGGQGKGVSKSRLGELIVKALKKKMKKKKKGNMKASKLKASVFKLGGIAESAGNVDAFFKVLQNKSKKFSFDGKRVSLK